MKKNWKLWSLFWRFIKNHKSDYKVLKQQEDVEYLFGRADEFCGEILSEYNINLDVEIDDDSFVGQQVLFVSNHQSMFDPLFIFQSVNHPCGFFIAGSFDRLLKIKVIRLLMQISQCVYIYPDDIRKTAAQIKKASDNIKNSNTSYMVFPEGKIKIESIERGEFDGKIGNFLPGAFKIAKLNNIPIVPITIKDSEKIHHTTNYLDMLNEGTIHIHFHKPIQPQEFKDLNTQEIADLAKNIIAKDL